MKKNPAMPAVFLALAFGFFSFIVWFPAQIRVKAAVALPRPIAASPAGSSTRADDPADTAVSDELLDYVRRERLAAETDGKDFEALFARASAELPAEDGLDPLGERFGPDETNDLDFRAGPRTFSVPEGLQDAVNFWRHIFGVYGKDQVVFYNEEDVGIVYSVLDFGELSRMNPATADSVRRQMVRQERRRIERMLERTAGSLGGAPDLSAGAAPSLSPEERRIGAKLSANGDHIAVDAAGLKDSLASRPGFAHRMREAVANASEYMPDMRRIFEERGLPAELTVLPLFESAFNTKAVSKAGAAGVWQFIASTGGKYLRIDEFVDERYDPILATYAAAAHLASEYRMFRDWPLTINSYNTGPGRVLDAVRRLKTNSIEKIVRHYRGAGYGFDSRNYYPEFLAALDVYRDRRRYFPDLPDTLPRGPPYEYVRLDAPTNLKELFRVAGFDERKMRELNPALRGEVLDGIKTLPKGYLVKVPSGDRDAAIYAAEELYADRVYATYHVVEEGEKIGAIASFYGLTPEELRSANGYGRGGNPRPGDVLRLPLSGEPPSLTVMRASSDEAGRLDEKVAGDVSYPADWD